MAFRTSTILRGKGAQLYMPLVKTTVELNADQKAFVVQKASELGLSQSALIRMAIEQYRDRRIEAGSSPDDLPSIFEHGHNGAFSESESEDWLIENWARDLDRDDDAIAETGR